MRDDDESSSVSPVAQFLSASFSLCDPRTCPAQVTSCSLLSRLICMPRAANATVAVAVAVSASAATANKQMNKCEPELEQRRQQ